MHFEVQKTSPTPVERSEGFSLRNEKHTLVPHLVPLCRATRTP